MNPALPPRAISPALRRWGLYGALVATVGLLQSLAALQLYLQHGGEHPWEPVLWETSSIVCVGLLVPLIYRGHRLARRWGGARALALHLAGALAYCLLHTGGMFGIRYIAYALAGSHYEPGSALQVLGYESAKDLVSYVVFVGLSHGLQLYFDVQRRERELQATQAALAEARLARLSEQVQPHFLFNSLNLISSVMYEDVPRADRLLCQLADLLRAALDAQQQPWHSLEAELQLVQPFLALMQARFGPRLQVQIEADAGARACRLPSLLLLNPVENAIKHDVAVGSGPVLVRLQARRDPADGRLHLSLSNSGTAAAAYEREGAFGLSNLRERLRASYGGAAALEIGPLPSGGTELRLQLPPAPTLEIAAA